MKDLTNEEISLLRRIVEEARFAKGERLKELLQVSASLPADQQEGLSTTREILITELATLKSLSQKF